MVEQTNGEHEVAGQPATARALLVALERIESIGLAAQALPSAASNPQMSLAVELILDEVARLDAPIRDALRHLRRARRRGDA